MKDYQRLMQQIGKAAKILDLQEDFPQAIRVLQCVLDDPATEEHILIKLEALVFLADIHSELGRPQEARRYIALAEALDVRDIEPDLVDNSLAQMEEVKAALE